MNTSVRRPSHAFRKAGPAHRLRLAPPTARAPLWRIDAVVMSTRTASPLRRPGLASLTVPADAMRRIVRGYTLVM